MKSFLKRIGRVVRVSYRRVVSGLVATSFILSFTVTPVLAVSKAEQYSNQDVLKSATVQSVQKAFDALLQMPADQRTPSVSVISGQDIANLSTNLDRLVPSATVSLTTPEINPENISSLLQQLSTNFAGVSLEGSSPTMIAAAVVDGSQAAGQQGLMLKVMSATSDQIQSGQYGLAPMRSTESTMMDDTSFHGLAQQTIAYPEQTSSIDFQGAVDALPQDAFKDVLQSAKDKATEVLTGGWGSEARIQADFAIGMAEGVAKQMQQAGRQSDYQNAQMIVVEAKYAKYFILKEENKTEECKALLISMEADAAASGNAALETQVYKSEADLLAEENGIILHPLLAMTSGDRNYWAEQRMEGKLTQAQLAEKFQARKEALDIAAQVGFQPGNQGKLSYFAERLEAVAGDPKAAAETKAQIQSEMLSLAEQQPAIIDTIEGCSMCSEYDTATVDRIAASDNVRDWRFAAFKSDQAETLDQLASKTSDYDTLATIARSPFTAEATLNKIVDKTDHVGVLRDVVGRESVSEALLDKAVSKSDDPVILKNAAAKTTSDATLAKIAGKSTDPQILLTTALNPAASTATLKTIETKTGGVFTFAKGTGRFATADVLERAVDLTSDPEYLTAIAGCPAATGAALDKIAAKTDDPAVLRAVVINNNAEASTLISIVEKSDDDVDLLDTVAIYAKTEETSLAVLEKVPANSYRIWLVINNQTVTFSEPTLAAIVDKSDSSRVLLEVAVKTSSPVTLDKIAEKTSDGYALAAVAWNSAATTVTLSKIVEKTGLSDALANVANHPAVDDATLEKIAHTQGGSMNTKYGEQIRALAQTKLEERRSTM